MKNDKKSKLQENKTNEQAITRKQAIQKAGLITLSTASMLLLLKSPAKAKTSPTMSPSNW
jgi:hypothetical protein